jgi:hypothetical protein
MRLSHWNGSKKRVADETRIQRLNLFVLQDLSPQSWLPFRFVWISLNSKARYDPRLVAASASPVQVKKANIVFALGLDHKIWCRKELKLVRKFEDNS